MIKGATNKSSMMFETKLNKEDGSSGTCYLESELTDLGDITIIISLLDGNKNKLGGADGTICMETHKLENYYGVPNGFISKLDKPDGHAILAFLQNYQRVKGFHFKGVGIELLKAFFDICKIRNCNTVVLNAPNASEGRGPLSFYEQVPYILQRGGSSIEMLIVSSQTSTWFKYNLRNYKPSKEIEKEEVKIARLEAENEELKRKLRNEKFVVLDAKLCNMRD